MRWCALHGVAGEARDEHGYARKLQSCIITGFKHHISQPAKSQPKVLAYPTGLHSAPVEASNDRMRSAASRRCCSLTSDIITHILTSSINFLGPSPCCYGSNTAAGGMYTLRMVIEHCSERMQICSFRRRSGRLVPVAACWPSVWWDVTAMRSVAGASVL